jgi:hypothetical protein
MDDKNPWLSMWVSPRATVRNIVAQNPKKCLWILAFIYGFTSLLNCFQSVPIAVMTGLLPMFFITLVLATFWGYAFFAIWSWVITFTGKLFKGKATFAAARAAYAWSCVPLLGNVVLWLLLVGFYGRMLFFGPQHHVTLSGPALTLLFIILIGKLIFAIWSVVLYLQALAEVQGYSVLRSIGNVIVATLFLVIVIAVLWLILGLLAGGCSATAAGINWNSANYFAQFIK